MEQQVPATLAGLLSGDEIPFWELTSPVGEAHHWCAQSSAPWFQSRKLASLNTNRWRGEMLEPSELQARKMLINEEEKQALLRKVRIQYFRNIWYVFLNSMVFWG